MPVVVLLTGIAAGCCSPCHVSPCRVSPCEAPAAMTQRAPNPRQVFLDMSTARIPEALITEVLGTLRPESAEQPRVLSKDQAAKLLAAWSDDDRVRVISSPKLLAVDGQIATIFVGESIHYAKTKATKRNGGLEFSIEDQPGSPILLGYQLQATATVSANGEQLTLDLHGIWRELKDADSHADAAQSGAAEALRPAVHEQTLDTHFDMENDGHVLVAPREIAVDATGRHLQVTLLQARILKGPHAD